MSHISLFTGIGGFDLGLAKAGIQTRAMVEWSKECCMTLRANWTHKELAKRECYPDWIKPGKREPVILERDITTLKTSEILKAAELEIGECSVITAGFPCQGFSMAGRRMIDDPRNVLYKEWVRIINEAKPKFIIGENVPGLVSMGKGEIIKQICQDLASCGYNITWDILNAADYGVPQNRRRVFIIGQRIDLLKIGENGRPSLHLGVGKGEIRHPKLFYERLKRWKKGVRE
jgi:DNA (cytosine-5)-methyltransferase 1